MKKQIEDLRAELIASNNLAIDKFIKELNKPEEPEELYVNIYKNIKGGRLFAGSISTENTPYKCEWSDDIFHGTYKLVKVE